MSVILTVFKLCKASQDLIGCASQTRLSYTMNRKKKINSILKAKVKKKNAKLHKSNKPRYISKAERAKMEEEEKAQQLNEQTEQISDSEES